MWQRLFQKKPAKPAPYGFLSLFIPTKGMLCQRHFGQGVIKAFNGHVIIQTMFMRGEILPSSGEEGLGVEAISVDNTSDEYVLPWLEALKEIAPQQVMIYTIDRETPVQGLQKATHEQLDAIRDRVQSAGIPCTASY